MFSANRAGCGHIGGRGLQALAFASECGNYFDVCNRRHVDAIANSELVRLSTQVLSGSVARCYTL